MTEAESTTKESWREPVNFLELLRPSGPWVLTAITPHGATNTITARTAAEIDTFVREHDGKRNLYYSVNPTKGAVFKKAAKADMAAVEYLLADLDPQDNETSENAKARYLNQLNGDFEPKPSAIVDSGNGIQCLWRLKESIALNDANDRDAIIADVEARSFALMVRLGAKAGTQNIDRILRLPGTTNLPNAKKLKAGRVPCPTKLLAFNGASYPLELFVPGTPDDGGHHARQEHADNQRRAVVNVDALPVSDRIKNLIRGINDPEHTYNSRSEAVFAVIVALVSAKCPDQQIQDVMFDKRLPIGDHVREQSNPADYLIRQIRHALAKIGGPGAVVRAIKIKARMEDVLKSAEELRTKIFEPLRLIVPKYLPEGLTLLGGRPKIGKSWQALDIAVGVSEGGKCLGQQCEQGDVLALMLEDSARRLQRRLTQMLGAQLREWPARLIFATNWPRLNEGGVDWMRDWISRSPKPRLIVVDILERVRQLVPSKDKDKRSAYSADYEATLITLHELATEAMISILVLHHQRKLGADDLIDTLSGTLGLGGAVDSVLILGKEHRKGRKDRESDNKFLWGRGRDLEEFSVSVKQNEKGRWNVLGLTREAQPTEERADIISVLASFEGNMSISEIAQACNSDYDNVKNLLSKLHAEGHVERVRRGTYRLAGSQDKMPF
jgi:AAA domain